ncbi:putative pectinesterase/pectinesterase inhibitor 45 [Senna tora]|uniref:Putative pectinesterase/pectinesterase inhibitor 45 n=1 Tax=Senna tora TaxID=362788 RepID=A0A834TAC8_9FABA|nr:putative pectinesterase/pectinesterase inhibitor 45 [Senna tora]
MEFSKSLVLFVSVCCLVVSSINAVPISRSQSLSVEVAAAPTPSHGHGLINGVVSKAVPHLAELQDLCKDGENVDLCIETIAPEIHGALDPVHAAIVEIGATLNETLKVSSIIRSLKEDPKTSKGMIDALDICADQYDLITDTIAMSLELMHQNDVAGAWTTFSAVISCQSTCEDAFKESPGEAFPFADDSKTLFQLGGNTLAILMRLNGETSPY